MKIQIIQRSIQRTVEESLFPMFFQDRNFKNNDAGVASLSPNCDFEIPFL